MGRHAARHRQRHRIRHLPDHRLDGGGAAVDDAGAGRVDCGRVAGHGRRLDLRRDGIDVPALGRPLRLPVRSVRARLGVPLRLGVPARHPDRQRGHRRRGLCRVLQLLRPGPRHRPDPADAGDAVGAVEHQRRPARGGGIDCRHHRHQLRGRRKRQPRQHGAHGGQGGRCSSCCRCWRWPTCGWNRPSRRSCRPGRCVRSRRSA